MSKLILWVGFILSIVLLLFGIFFAEKANPLAFILWITILIGTGYKLFFVTAQNESNQAKPR